ncbi:ornithine carbamoyltransferase [Chamaesiphon sp. GL140_3_metabinner_50]|uniref:ornithine carbamoyltransferase n=1 Tax=Chamaesiphon sp. GL140_3_metabinner_50 TaxID=2970812 RepID=UPI0025CFCC10|nr:ornithine carbamoyltransferase [Chamaesiphon sp. GL140_3_metabinner_50]
MSGLTGRDLLSMTDLSTQETLALLQLATDLKQGKIKPVCQKTLGLLFYKASTRTRVSFFAAMSQLGGQVIDLNIGAMQIGRGEPLADTARVLDRYLDVLAIRTFEQADVETFAKYARMPIINALTDLEHPCQVLADLQTIQECFGQLAGLKLAYLGDGNNMAHSLMLGCATVGMDIAIACPANFTPDPQLVDRAKSIAAINGTQVIVTRSPQEAVSQAHVVYTDVWASMGQETESDARMPVFQPYQVNQELLTLADPNSIVLHCLPAHRGEEITNDVLEGTRSRVWDQAENRMHAQKALLVSVLGGV